MLCVSNAANTTKTTYGIFEKLYSRNVECNVATNLPDAITSNKTIDMLVVGFEAGKENLDSQNYEDIKFILYPSNVISKELTNSTISIQLYYSQSKSTKGNNKKFFFNFLKIISSN